MDAHQSRNHWIWILGAEHSHGILLNFLHLNVVAIADLKEEHLKRAQIKIPAGHFD